MSAISGELAEARAAAAAAREGLEEIRREEAATADIGRFVNLLEEWESLSTQERRAVLGQWVERVVAFRPHGRGKAAVSLRVEVVYRWGAGA